MPSTLRWGVVLWALSACITPGHALMFASDAVSKQWDTWCFYENSTFYAYYLITEVSYGEGFGVATSSDGQHWTDHGYVWHGPSWTERHLWEGSSAVWRAADWNQTGRYLINYSQMNNGGASGCGCQNITFAQSFDLIHWENANETMFNWFDIDAAAGYKVLGGRWDTIYSIPVPAAERQRGQGRGHPEGGHAAGVGGRDGFPRYGFWTASPENGTMGFGRTYDGTSWQALPSPTMLPEPIGAEVGAVDWVPAEALDASAGTNASTTQGAYVAMLGYGWPRTMLAYTAPSPAGPYTRAQKNVNFLNGSCYFSRFFHGPNNVLLVTHQTWDNRGTHTSFVSPFKRAVLDADGTFRLKWWSANENLKGAKYALPATAEPAGGDPFYHVAPANVSHGLLMEADFVLPASPDPADWPGFLLETEAPGAVFVGMDHLGVCNVGDYKIRLPSDYLNWTDPAEGGSDVSVPTHDGAADWEYAGGAGSAASREPGGGVDIRSGGPGQMSLALVAHPLFSEGHLIESAAVSFQYVAGYGCTPNACDAPPSASLVIVDAFNHTVVRTLWMSGPLDKYSYDSFSGYSAPVTGSATSVNAGWPRQTQLALLFNNSKHNLQIPVNSLNMTLGWSSKVQPEPWVPASLTQVDIRERWSRDLPFSPGQRVHARLLARRSMLEMYVDDHLFPVYAAPDQTGRFGITNATLVSAVQAWNMSLEHN